MLPAVLVVREFLCLWMSVFFHFQNNCFFLIFYFCSYVQLIARIGTFKLGISSPLCMVKTWWVGEVLELKGEDAHINFLLNKGENKYWPDKRDQDWIRRTGIFAIFPTPPIPVSSRHLGFAETTFRSVATRISTMCIH